MAGETIAAVLTIDAIVEAAVGVGLKESFKKAGGAVSQKLQDSSLWKKHTGQYHKELVISLAKGRETWETLRNEDKEKFNNADESAICVAACHSELGRVLKTVLLNLQASNDKPPPEQCNEWIELIDHAEKSFLAAIDRYSLITDVVGDRQTAELKQLIIETRERLLLCSQKPMEVNATGPGAVAAASNNGEVFNIFNYYNSNVKELLKNIRKPTNLQWHWNQFHKGTREWMFSAVHEWFKSSSQNTTKVFTLVGHAGVGKSTFAAQLVLHGYYTLQPSVSPVAAYFFYDHQSDRSAKQCVLSLCKQLCGRLPQFHECLDAAISQEDIDRWSVEICFRELLLTPLNSYGENHAPARMIVVIDALDECDEANLFKHKVVDQWKQMPDWLLLFVTCRQNVIDFPKNEEEAAREGITMLKIGDPEIVDESECVKRNMNDIRIVLRDWLKCHFKTAESLEKAVEDFTRQSCGMFLYLRFLKEQLDKLQNGEVLKPEDMPAGIGVHYEKYFSRVLRALSYDKETYDLTLGPVLTSREPLPLALWMRAFGVQGNLNDGKQRDVEYRTFRMALDICKSLMYIPNDVNHPSHLGIAFIHKSMTKFSTGGYDDQGTALNLDEETQLHVPMNHTRMVQLLENLGEEPHVVKRFVERNLFYHRCKAQLFDEAVAMLFDLDSLLSWLKYASPIEIIHDIVVLLQPNLNRPDEQADVQVILKLLRLGNHALTSGDLPKEVAGKQLPSQLPGQILGRLSEQDVANRPNLQALRDAANKYDPGVSLPPADPSLASTFPGGLMQMLEGHFDAVLSVAFNHDGTRIVSGSRDKTIRIWDASTGQPIGEPLEGHSGWVSSVAYNHDGTRVVSGSRDKTIRIWDASTGQPIGEPLQGHSDSVHSVAFNHDGTRIVSGSNDMTIRIWDAVTGQPIGEPLKGHSHYVYSVAFNHDGTRIVSGSWDNTIRIWDAVTGQPIGEPLKGHSNSVHSVAFNHDGTRIVSCSDDVTIRIWDTITGQPIGEPLKSHSDSVRSVAFNHDGTRIVSGSNDRTIRIWDVVTGQPIGETLEGHSGWVSSVAYNHDGTRVVSGSWDNTIRIWNASIDQPIGEPLEDHSEGIDAETESPETEEEKLRKAFEEAVKDDKQSQRWGRCKLMVLGPGRAGKTQLIRALRGQDFQQKSPSTVIAEEAVTVCVDGNTWKEREKSFTEEVIAKIIHYGGAKTHNVPPIGFGEKAQSVEGSESNTTSNDGESEDDDLDEARQSDNPQESQTEPTVAMEASEQNTSPDQNLVATDQSSVSVIPQQVISLPEYNPDRFANVEQDSLSFTVIDFGGQIEFRSVHKIFLTEYGLYVVVVNLHKLLGGDESNKKNKEEEEESNTGGEGGKTTENEELLMFRFWFGSVRNRAPDARIMIVGTHLDKIGKGKLEKERMLDEAGKMLKVEIATFFETSREIAGTVIMRSSAHDISRFFFPVDNQQRERTTELDEIKTAIVANAKNLDFVKWNVPIIWGSLYDYMVTTDKPIMQIHELETLSDTELPELRKMLYLFNQLGVVLYWGAGDITCDEDDVLNQLIIINPNWLLQRLSFLFFDPKQHIDQIKAILPNDKDGTQLIELEEMTDTGLLSKELLPQIWENHYAEFLLKLTQIHWLICDSVNPKGKECYAVPSVILRLNDISDDEFKEWWEAAIENFKSGEALLASLEVDHIEDGFFHMLINACEEKIKSKIVALICDKALMTIQDSNCLPIRFTVRRQSKRKDSILISTYQPINGEEFNIFHLMCSVKQAANDLLLKQGNCRSTAEMYLKVRAREVEVANVDLNDPACTPRGSLGGPIDLHVGKIWCRQPCQSEAIPEFNATNATSQVHNDNSKGNITTHSARDINQHYNIVIEHHCD